MWAHPLGGAPRGLSDEGRLKDSVNDAEICLFLAFIDGDQENGSWLDMNHRLMMLKIMANGDGCWDKD